MKRIARFALPVIVALAAVLFSVTATAGGYINIGTSESPMGSGNTSGAGSFNTGEWVYLYSWPEEGYAFDHWEIVNTANDAVLYTFYDQNPGFNTDGLADIDLWAIAYFTPVGHTHTLQHVSFKYPTCQGNGVIEHYWCSTCGNHYALDGVTELSQSDWELPPNGHSWSDWSISSSTCVKAGQKYRYCPDCGAEEYESLPLTGHSWSEWQTTSAATCDKDGSKVRKCTVCGTEEYETIAASGHNWVEVAYKAATCTSDGNAAYAYCATCGIIVDSPSAMDPYEKIPVIPANGHDFGTWKVTKEPTCTEAGEETRSCGSCSVTETRTVNALGHEWDAGEVTIEPTATATGIRTFHCTRCGATKTEPIDVTGKSTVNTGGENGSGTSTEPAPAPAPTPSPAPEPSPSVSIPVPLIIAGAVGLVALGALIALLIFKRRDSNDDRPTHMA